MIYLIAKESDISNSSKRKEFTAIKQQLLREDYQFYVTNLSADDIEFFTYETGIKLYILFPYISVILFDEIYGSGYADKLSMKKTVVDYSFFNFLMYNNQNIIPEQYKYYYLISDLMKNVNREEYLEGLVNLEKFLSENNLLLDTIVFRPSLNELLAETIEKHILTEIDDEIITTEDLEHQAEMYNINVITDFLLKASKYYPKNIVKKYISEEFYVSSKRKDNT